MSEGQGPVGGQMRAGELRAALMASDALRAHGDDLVLALVLAGKVVDVWTAPAADRVLLPGAVRSMWPDLGEALDALTKGPE